MACQVCGILHRISTAVAHLAEEDPVDRVTRRELRLLLIRIQEQRPQSRGEEYLPVVCTAEAATQVSESDIGAYLEELGVVPQFALEEFERSLALLDATLSISPPCSQWSVPVTVSERVSSNSLSDADEETVVSEREEEPSSSSGAHTTADTDYSVISLAVSLNTETRVRTVFPIRDHSRWRM